MSLGDTNLAYFNACLAIKVVQNHIRSLTTTAWVLVQAQKEVQSQITEFYKLLLGTPVKQLLVMHIKGHAK